MLPEIVTLFVAQCLDNLDGVALPLVERQTLDLADVRSKRSVSSTALVAHKHAEIDRTPRRLFSTAVGTLCISLHLIGSVVNE